MSGVQYGTKWPKTLSIQKIQSGTINSGEAREIKKKTLKSRNLNGRKLVGCTTATIIASATPVNICNFHTYENG
jgi:hypothetical protein